TTSCDTCCTTNSAGHPWSQRVSIPSPGNSTSLSSQANFSRRFPPIPHNWQPSWHLLRDTVLCWTGHPREVVRACMEHNACAVIFAHNHPSQVAEPSAADRAITHELRDALRLIGVRLLDHLVIGAGEPVSMAARGLI
ncbi:MAG TPA: JAB domain-containing protein, partial [Rhodanobacter sp.]|nr:JAB domain-containing protein [Rhodanobacter sp.]